MTLLLALCPRLRAEQIVAATAPVALAALCSCAACTIAVPLPCGRARCSVRAWSNVFIHAAVHSDMFKV